MLAAAGLPVAAARSTWRVHGEEVPADDVAHAQRRWYADRPDAVAAGLARRGRRLVALGLA